MVYNGPVNGDDVATAMGISDLAGVFVCGYTPHYVVTHSSSSSRGASGPTGGTLLAVPDTDYIVVGYKDGDLFGGETWSNWEDIGLPNEEGVRVYNGPGPNSNASDDRAADIDFGRTGWEIWVTGTVRENDAVGYDTTTICYFQANSSPTPLQTEHISMSMTTEKAYAIVVNDDPANPTAQGGVFVTGTIALSPVSNPVIQTFKFVSGTAGTQWTSYYLGASLSNFPAQIIAPKLNTNKISTIVAGSSQTAATWHDQIGIHYKQP